MPQNETKLDLSYVACFERFTDMKKCFSENAQRTIDYLEEEIDQLRKGGEEERQNRNFLMKQKEGDGRFVMGRRMEEEGGEKSEEGVKEEEEEEEGNFDIAKPPIIFVNDRSPKHPNIKDDYVEENGGGGGGKGKEGGRGRRMDEAEGEKGEEEDMAAAGEAL